MSGFNPHGDFRVAIDGRVVTLSARGPFNLEVTIEFGRAIVPVIERLQGAPWAVLVQAEGEFLFTPDAEQALRQAEAVYEAAGRVASAIVVAETGWSWLVQRQMERIHAENRQRPRFFTELEPARQWLLQALQRVPADGIDRLE